MLGNFHVAVMIGCRPRSPARVDNGCTLEFFQRCVIEIPQRHTARVSSFTGLVLMAVLIRSDPSFGLQAIQGMVTSCLFMMMEASGRSRFWMSLSTQTHAPKATGTLIPHLTPLQHYRTSTNQGSISANRTRPWAVQRHAPRVDDNLLHVSNRRDASQAPVFSLRSHSRHFTVITLSVHCR